MCLFKKGALSYEPTTFVIIDIHQLGRLRLGGSFWQIQPYLAGLESRLNNKKHWGKAESAFDIVKLKSLFSQP